MSKTLINNVIFVVDGSGSMTIHERAVNSVIQNLRGPLSSQDQVTRVSLYVFDDRIERKLYLRHPDALANFKTFSRGQTALVDAYAQAIEDHKNIITGDDEDHAFILYGVTDGAENASRKYNPTKLATLIRSLPSNWTVAALVPNVTGRHYAKNIGIPDGNIEIWNTTSSAGFEEVGRRVADTYTSYSKGRSAGVTSSTRLFVDAASITPEEAKKNLIEDRSLRQYTVTSSVAEPIREYVERVTGRPYIIGAAFYQLTKPEKIQGGKAIAIRSKSDGKVYSGPAARQMLGLPTYDLDVKPGQFGDWEVYIQSTSVNRKLIPGQNFLTR
jgi:hypothetical protein